jgi:hypothetical protein
MKTLDTEQKNLVAKAISVAFQHGLGVISPTSDTPLVEKISDDLIDRLGLSDALMTRVTKEFHAELDEQLGNCK